MVEKKSMDSIWKQITQQYGDEGLFSGDMDGVGQCDVIPTGSYALDDITGVGGIPRGALTQFAGIQSSGKTLIALSTLAQWQKQDPNNWGLFIDCEFTFDSAWAARLGVDLKRVKVYKENRGAQIFELLVGQPDKKVLGKKTKLGILDLAIQEKDSNFGLIILDSIAMIQAPVEEVTQIEGQSMAALPRFLGPALRRLTPLLSTANVAFIGINQLRDSMAMYSQPDSPGGRCLKHAASLQISFTRLTGADHVIERNDEQVGHVINSKVTKNKLSSPFKSAEFSIEYLKGVVKKENEIRDLGVKYGLIKRINNRTYELDNQQYVGKDKIAVLFAEELAQNSMWARIAEAKKTYSAPTNETDDTTEDTDNVDDSEVKE
jgi:recombination protein RecA